MSPRYLLDTNIVSHIMQGRDSVLLQRLASLRVGDAVISSVTLAELEYGLHRRNQPPKLRNALTQVLLRMDVLAWDETVARCYGELCATLESRGVNLSDLDMMVAAHAKASSLTLVSRDRAFAQIAPAVVVEVW